MEVIVDILPYLGCGAVTCILFLRFAPANFLRFEALDEMINEEDEPAKEPKEKIDVAKVLRESYDKDEEERKKKQRAEAEARVQNLKSKLTPDAIEALEELKTLISDPEAFKNDMRLIGILSGVMCVVLVLAVAIVFHIGVDEHLLRRFTADMKMTAYGLMERIIGTEGPDVESRAAEL